MPSIAAHQVSASRDSRFMARGRAIRPNCVWPCLGAQIPDLPETATSFESAGLLRATHLSARQGSAEAARIFARASIRTTENAPARSGPPTSPFTDAVPERPAFLRRVRAEGYAIGFGPEARAPAAHTVESIARVNSRSRTACVRIEPHRRDR